MAEQADRSVGKQASTELPPIQKRFRHSKQTSWEGQSSDKLMKLERGFVLDGVAVSKLSNDETERTQPSLNMGIPQYNALHDKHCKKYFTSKGLPKFAQTAKSHSLNVESEHSATMMGKVFDKFVRHSVAKQYLGERESVGAGYTRTLYGGHLSIPTAPPVVGYNGDEGYRRNTFDLRQRKSVFDNEDPFDNPKTSIASRRLRTQSAPATIRLMRLKSASVYRAPPGGRVRAVSAMPKTVLERRELATGPVQ